jgi:hypothetical protein
MPLTANKAKEQINDDCEDEGKNSSHDSIPSG